MNTEPPRRRQLSGNTWLALLALALSTWLVIQGFGLVVEVASVLFGATLISLATRPLVDYLAAHHIPRVLTMIVIYLVGLAIISTVGALLVPVTRSEVAALQQDGPALAASIVAWARSLPVVGSLIPSTNSLLTSVFQRLGTISVTILDTITSIGGTALDVVISLVIAVFFTTDPGLNSRSIERWIGIRARPRVHTILMHIQRRLQRWVWAQLAIALYFAVSFSVGLTVLGVPAGLTIGVLGGLLEIVPYLGGAIATILAVLSALTLGPLRALWVVLLYLVIVEVESHIVAPAFYGRILGLPPALVLIALVVGLKLYGIVGVFFAVPLAVVVVAILEELYPPGTDDEEAPEGQ